jgi:hypothetical protein
LHWFRRAVKPNRHALLRRTTIITITTLCNKLARSQRWDVAGFVRSSCAVRAQFGALANKMDAV